MMRRRNGQHRAERKVTARRSAAAIAVACLTTSLLVGVAHGAWGANEPYRIGTLILSDSFTRSVSGGWGRATSGQSFTADTAKQASVVSGAGRVDMVPGQTVQLVAAGTSALDARVASTVSVSSLPLTGNGASASLQLRANGNTTYRATLRFGRDNKVSLKLERANGAETILVSDKLLPVEATTAAAAFRFEFQTTGTSPVELAARAWPVGTATPDWQVTASDSNAKRLSTAGAISVNAALSSSTAALALKFDDLDAVTLVRGAAPVPTPTPTATPAPSATPTPMPTPTAKPTPSATPTPTPSATPAPAPALATPPAPLPQPSAQAPVPVPASSPGSAPVGTTRYTVPSGAIFAEPRGDDKGNGTEASPYGSAATALAKAPSGSTIVLRGGSYHESVQVGFLKALTVQSYPGEAVWFDGSSPVAGWKQSGATWYVDGWNYNFDHRVSFSAGVDESSRWLLPEYPMAGYPDQVWVGGTELAQVGSAAAVVPGTFFVDTAAKQLAIGSDPAAGVRASTLEKALQIQGAGTTIRGIGVRNYADHLSTLGVVSAEVPNITLENLTVQNNASVGIYVWAKGDTFSKITSTDNGMLGLVASKSDDLTISDSVFSRNNAEHFKDAPASGGAKLHNSTNVTVQRSVFDSNVSGGLWFDVNMRNTKVLNNTISNNGSTGFELELSENVTVAGNYIVGNARAGLEIYDTGTVDVSNNTIVNNVMYAVRMLQDERRNTDPAVPWVLRNVTVRNNVISAAPGSMTSMQIHDLTHTVYAGDLNITFDGNLYNRPAAGNPSRLVQWANGPTLLSYNTVADFRTATGNDQKSKTVDGSSILDGSFALNAAGSSAAAGLAVPVTDKVSLALGVSSGWTSFGPQQAIRR
jgi:trimeric autotransporter adhesin